VGGSTFCNRKKSCPTWSVPWKIARSSSCIPSAGWARLRRYIMRCRSCQGTNTHQRMLICGLAFHVRSSLNASRERACTHARRRFRIPAFRWSVGLNSYVFVKPVWRFLQRCRDAGRATRHSSRPKGLDAREGPLLPRREKCFLLTSPLIEPASHLRSLSYRAAVAITAKRPASLRSAL